MDSISIFMQLNLSNKQSTTALEGSDVVEQAGAFMVQDAFGSQL